jgi:serine/threonine-protein kinase RsbW
MTTPLVKTIRSETDNLLAVREFVGAAARAFGFSEEETSKIVLAVDEACTNIIKHAYQFATDREIRIAIYREKDRFEVRIHDTGRTFDPKTLVPLDLKDHLTHYRRGGLGVYLMRSLMDKVEYRTLPDNRNEVRLVKFLAPLKSHAR